MNLKLSGLQYAFLAALISGVSVFVNKLAVDAVKPALLFTTSKNFLVGFILVGILLATTNLDKLRAISKKDTLYLLAIAIVGGSIPFYLFFTGLAHTSAINGAMIQKSMIFWIALLAIPILKEKLNPVHMIGVLSLFIANFAVGGFKGFKFDEAELMIFAATLMWSVEHILVKKVLVNIDVKVALAARMFGGALILGVLTLIEVPQSKIVLNSEQWGWILLTVALLLGYVFTWYSALQKVPALMVASILVLATLITNVLTAVLTTHTWNFTLTIQSLLMLVGIGILYLGHSKKSLERA